MIDYIDCRLPLTLAGAIITGLRALSRYTDDHAEELMARQAADEIARMAEEVRDAIAREQEELDKQAAYDAVPKMATRPPATGSGF